jgi:conjugative relaxase-like TrwC/TraI family protein
VALMMSISAALSAAQTTTYFDEHYSQDEYYTQGQTCVGQWLGRGAVALGLVGDVSREDFSALLQGINPRSGAVIIAAATHNGEHRAGWDSVFSAPKSVSLQALVGGDGRLIQTHAQAVQRSVAEVEAYALARKRGGREYVVSGNVVAAAFNHLAARPADNVRLPDPQLHTHVVLLNLTRRPDGAWRAGPGPYLRRAAIWLGSLSGGAGPGSSKARLPDSGDRRQRRLGTGRLQP